MPATERSFPPSLEDLIRQVPQLWRGNSRPEQSGLSSGFKELDDALPAGGWPLGSLIELAPSAYGIGELSLVLPALRTVASEARPVAIVAPPFIPYAPAWRRAGIPLRLLWWIADTHEAQAHWAAEQLVRDGAGVVLLWSSTSEDRCLRRLQLAAETSRRLAFVYRPPATLAVPSPAAVRIGLQPAGESKLKLNIIKARGGRPVSTVVSVPQLIGTA